MAKYKCFFCNKEISSKNLKKRFLCPECGGRIFFKPKEQITKVKAV